MQGEREIERGRCTHEVMGGDQPPIGYTYNVHVYRQCMYICESMYMYYTKLAIRNVCSNTLPLPKLLASLKVT